MGRLIQFPVVHEKAGKSFCLHNGENPCYANHPNWSHKECRYVEVTFLPNVPAHPCNGNGTSGSDNSAAHNSRERHYDPLTDRYYYIEPNGDTFYDVFDDSD